LRSTDWALGAGSRPEAWQDRDDVPTGVERPLPDGERIAVPAAVLLRGGHFAAMEEPALLAADIREFFGPLRAVR
jgi:hypothetical protein